MIHEATGQSSFVTDKHRPSLLRAMGKRVRRYLNRIIIGLGVVCFLAVFISPDVFFTIHSGEVGVLYLRFFGGTQTDRVLGEGVQVIAPWDRLTIYTTRVQEEKHEMNVLTKEGLSVRLHLSIRYHPESEMVGMLHQRVGPNYKDRIVIPEVESALRTIMGALTMPEVYGSEQGLLQKVINESLESASQKFVKIDDVVLRTVELPPAVRSAIEEKMTQKQLAEAYEYRLHRERQEAERKVIEAGGFKRYNEVLTSSITPALLRWKGIEATKELAQSPNSKIIFVGNKQDGLPVVLGGESGGK
jgi:regulator of protease activity HflC (stomatin/prohibitin superfamily)